MAFYKISDYCFIKKQRVVRYQSKFATLFLAGVFFFIIAMNPVKGFGANTTDETMSFIPDSLVSLPVGHAIVIDKTMQRLFVYHFDGTSFQRTYESVCSTGKNKGTKIRSGDARTPEGIYFPIKFFPDKDLGSIYGSMAFDLNYPNILDKKEGNNGNNIWIHGTDKPLSPYQSNGCIALENGDIKDVSQFITLNETPIIIQDYIKWAPASIRVSLEEDLTSFVDRWADIVSDGSVQKLGKLYGKDSLYDKKGRDQLARQIRTLKKYGGVVTFAPKNLSLLKHDRYTVAAFQQEFTVNGHPYEAGPRRLFLKKWRNNWYIEGDMALNPEKEHYLIAVLEKTNNGYASHNDIIELVDKWVASWESGDMKGYASFYAADFKSKSKGMDLDGWLAYKSNLHRSNKNIHIGIKKLKISHRSADKLIATFEQRYRSSRISDVGTKTLYFKNIDNSWKIWKENWRSKTAK
ncbi:MAG: L,D-transpeptidase [Deltaproteobacteria bacterium]|nr:L,D-transpeptidase [Deltaproteobacteria bacterium]